MAYLFEKSHASSVDGIEVGDKVFFYKYKYHKPLKDGTEHPLGRVGIVRVGFMIGDIRARAKSEAVVEYADGTVADWLFGNSNSMH